MLRRADIVLAVSEKTRRQLVGLEPKIENRSHTMFTGVDPEMLEIPSAGLTGPLRVIMLGSLTPEKDPSLALAAVSKVNGALLRFVGDGPLAHQLAEEAAGLGMANQVEFAGSVEDVRPHLEWAHVLILTSKSEGLPGAILEASAAGLAIVAVDVGGVEEAVIHGESGIVTDRDEIKLAEALYVLDEDREKLAAMGEAGRRHIRENFLIDEVVEHYRSVLRNQKR
jgi:glycosyltransferase involved in cell wall biosynthesis